jgi:hypothetical protein
MKSPLNRGGLRFYLVILCLGAGTLIAGKTTGRSILAGLPCLFLGVWLHTWAKGCLRQNRAVATSGPYRFVRHPFYLANALIDGGLVIMADWWPLMVILAFWWLAIYIPVIRHEERYLGENFADVYPEYRKRVPCLIPWRRPLAYRGEGFRWDNPNISGGEELPRAARILGYPLLFLAVAGLHASGIAWLDDGWNLTAVAGLIMLYVLGWELHRHQRQCRWILPSAIRHPMARVILMAAVLVVVCVVSGPRTSFQNKVPLAGAALLMISVPCFARRPARAMLAEALALCGAIAAGELLWLAPAVIVAYSAWALDWNLTSQTAADGQSPAPPAERFWPYLYPLLVVSAAAVVGVKLVGIVWPYHVFSF